MAEGALGTEKLNGILQHFAVSNIWFAVESKKEINLYLISTQFIFQSRASACLDELT